jgi:predicted dehydrogenase
MPQRYVDPLRVAFIGGAVSSAIGRTHFDACRMDGHFEVTAGCFSRSPEENKRSASLYGVGNDRVYESWEQLLSAERGRIDLIIVLTPTPSHTPIVNAALQVGYRVLCEKALSVSSADCALLEAQAAARARYLAVTFNYSGYPMVRQLRRWIADGRLGEIHHLHVEMPQEGFLRVDASPQAWRRKDHDVPTVSLDLGVHVHHLVSFLLSGRKPTSIVCDEGSVGRFPGIIDSVHCLARYDGGTLVNAWWGKTFLGHRNGLKLRAFGSLGSAEWYQMDPEHLRLSDNDGNTLIVDRGSGQAPVAQEVRYNRFKSGHPSGFIEAFANLYTDIAYEIREDVREPGAISPFVFGAGHSKEGLKLMEAARESARTGFRVAVSA